MGIWLELLMCMGRHAKHNEPIQCTTSSSSSNINKLDDNLLCEILGRLSAETVAQLIIINKRWYSLITSPVFISSHACRQSYQGPSQIIVRGGSHGGIEYLRFDLPTVTLKTIPLGLPCEIFRVYCCSHGLTLLECDADDAPQIYICNAFTKKILRIPYPKAKDVNLTDFLFGLVVDPVDLAFRNHYKVVFGYGKEVKDKELWRFKIFTSDTMRWRDSKETITCEHTDWSVYMYGSYSVCIKGVLYWHSLSGFIVAFDVNKERGYTFKAPQEVPCYRIRQIRTWVGVVEDRLNFVIQYGGEAIISVLYDDYENKTCWVTKRIKLMCDGFSWPFFYDGELLVLYSKSWMLTENNSQMGVYNVRTGSLVIKQGIAYRIPFLAKPTASTLFRL